MSEHIKHWNVIKMILNECEIKLKGEAVITAATSIHWFNSLDKILEQINVVEQKNGKGKEVLKKGKNANK